MTTTYTQVEFPLFLIATVANVALAVVVFRYAPRNISRYLFSLFVLVQIFWITANYVAFRVPLHDFLFVSRLTIFFAAFHAFFFFLFIYSFLESRNVLAKKILFPLSVFLIVVALLTLSPLVFTRISLDQKTAQLAPQVGPAISVFGLFVTLCILGAFYSIFRKYRNLQGIEKTQLKFLTFGLFLTFLLVLAFSFLNFAVFKNLSTVRFGHLYTLPFLLFTAYAMIRHHLLNIKAIIAELMVILLILILTIQVISSDSPSQFVTNIFVFSGTIIVGVLLIKGVIREIKQREELQKLTDQLKTANTQLESLSQFKSQMLSLASHQIKSPLAAIKGFVSILTDGLYGPVNDKVKETLGKVKASADELINLINTLLDLRKVEEGKMEYQFAKTDLVALAKEVFEGLKPLASEKKITFTFEMKLPQAFVSADALKLKQVLQNITDNSIKYTPKGFVKVELKEQGSNLVFSVSDSGLGISPDLLPHLFEEFIRDERVKNQIRGTGLGLYIARKIVEAHGGELWAESDGEGKGSKFYVKLKKVQ